MRLRIEALGGLRVIGGGSIAQIDGPHRLIVGYLLTNRERHVSRGQLAETLWADRDSNHARRCLSTALWRLKRSVPHLTPLLVFRGAEEVSFNWDAPSWVDFVAMEMRLAPLLRIRAESLTKEQISRLQRGLRLYRGDYLVGIEHEWAWIARQRLRNLFHDGLYHLTQAFAARSDWGKVLEWGRLLNQEEPLREDVHRLLMHAHAMTGNRAKAIEQYRLCERILRQDLGVEPMSETQDWYRALLSAENEAPSLRDGDTAEDGRLARSLRRIAKVRRAMQLSQAQLGQAIEEMAPGGPPRAA